LSWDDFNGRYGDWGRPLVLYLARRLSGTTLKEIGDGVGGMNYKAVSRALFRFKKRMEKDKKIAKIARKLLSEV